MMLCGILLARKDAFIDDTTIHHEKIHFRQQIEMLFVPFFVWYFVEYLVKLILYRNHAKAYYAISFEREAYANQYNKNYLRKRPFWRFLKYL